MNSRKRGNGFLLYGGKWMIAGYMVGADIFGFYEVLCYRAGGLIIIPAVAGV